MPTKPLSAGNGRISGRQEAVALLLAGGAKEKDAARQAGVGERTIRTWKADPAFRYRMSELRATLIEQGLHSLAEGLTEAVTQLRGLLCSENEAIALAAAKTMLDAVLKLQQQTASEKAEPALPPPVPDEELLKGLRLLCESMENSPQPAGGIACSGGMGKPPCRKWMTKNFWFFR